MRWLKCVLETQLECNAIGEQTRERKNDRQVEAGGRKKGDKLLGPEVETLSRSRDSGYKLRKSLARGR